MKGPLDREGIRSYFASPGTVSRWWKPDSEKLRFHYDAELQVLEREIQLPPGSRILDLGTGRGRIGLDFAARGHFVLGVDLSDEMLSDALAAAKRRGLEGRFTCRLGAAEDLSGIPSGSLDAVLCMELFDHLPELAPVLREVSRILKPGGIFGFSYVPSSSLYGMLGNLHRRWTRWRHGPGALISRTYRAKEIEGELCRAGLEPRHFAGIGLLCLNAQTRIALPGPMETVLNALARAEARRWPTHSAPALAHRCAHVVGIARKPSAPAP